MEKKQPSGAELFQNLVAELVVCLAAAAALLPLDLPLAYWKTALLVYAMRRIFGNKS